MLTKNMLRLDYDDLCTWLMETFNLDPENKRPYNTLFIRFPENGLSMEGDHRVGVLLGPDEPCDGLPPDPWGSLITKDVQTLLSRSVPNTYYKYDLQLTDVLYFAYLHGVIPQDEIFVYDSW